MPIIKNRTQSNFTQISNGILRDQKLPMKERGVLCTLLSFPDKWKFSVEGLSAIVPDGRDSLNHAINNLIEAGYVRRNQIRDHAGKFAVELELEDERGALLSDTDTDLPLRKNRCGSAVTDFTDTESAVTVNPTQYNNDIYNTDLYYINQSNNQIDAQETDGVSDASKPKKSLLSLEELQNDFEYWELMDILSFQHLLQEVEECQLTQYEVRMRVIEELKLRIGYKALIMDGDATLVDAILDYMAEVISANRTMKFGSETYDARSMGNAFYRLDFGAVQYVISQFKKYSEMNPIQNKKNYVIRMLLTAKSDMEMSIQADVNYDMAHWHEMHPKNGGESHGGL